MESSVLHHCRFTPAVVVTFMAVEWRADSPASANTPLGALIIQPVSGPGYGWILQLLSLRAAPAGAVLRIPGLHRIRCEDLSILMPIQTSLPRFSSIPTPLSPDQGSATVLYRVWWTGGVLGALGVYLRRAMSSIYYRHQPRVSQTLRKRQEDLPERIKQISWTAQDRLNWKYRRLVGRGKAKNKAIVAVARELLGFVWSIGQEVARESYVTQTAERAQ